MTKRKTIKRPNDFGTTRRKVDKYKGNLIDGLSQVLKLERGVLLPSASDIVINSGASMISISLF